MARSSGGGGPTGRQTCEMHGCVAELGLNVGVAPLLIQDKLHHLHVSIGRAHVQGRVPLHALFVHIEWLLARSPHCVSARRHTRRVGPEWCECDSFWMPRAHLVPDQSRLTSHLMPLTHRPRRLMSPSRHAVCSGVQPIQMHPPSSDADGARARGRRAQICGLDGFGCLSSCRLHPSQLDWGTKPRNVSRYFEPLVNAPTDLKINRARPSPLCIAAGTR